MNNNEKAPDPLTRTQGREAETMLDENISLRETTRNQLSHPADERKDETMTWLSLGDLARQRARRGATPKIPIGFPTIDRCLGGGLQASKFMVVGGEPGSGKTCLALIMAWTLVTERTDVRVAFAELDEADPAAIQTRIGQIEGFDRGALDRGDEGTWLALAENLDRVGDRFRLFTVADTESLLEMSEWLSATRQPGEHTFLFVDSLQKAACPERVRDVSFNDTERARVEALIRDVKMICADGHAVIATSEMARSSYRSAKKGDNIRALAGFKESGSIEYAIDVGIVLANVAEERVEGTVVKNRLGPLGSFSLSFQRESATLTDVGGCDPVPVGVSDDAKRHEIVDFVRNNPGVSQTSIVKHVGGNAKSVRKLVTVLVSDGTLTNAATSKRGWELFATASGHVQSRPDSVDVVPHATEH